MSKPSSLKESKSCSHPGLGFTCCMYHLDNNDVKLEHDTRHLQKDSGKLSKYWDDSHESQDVSTWYFMTVTQSNPNTPIHPVNGFAHANKICLERKQMDPFHKFGIYMKDIPGSISLFGLGKKSYGIHSDEVVSLKIPLSSKMAGLPSNNALGTCPWCWKLSKIRLSLSNHIRQEHYHLTLICHVCGTYHTLCGDVMKGHMKSCNERNWNLVLEKIFYSFRVDRPSDAPESVRTDTSHAAETSDDDMPIKSSKQQPSSVGKSQAGGTSSSDHGTSDSEAESPLQTLTPLSTTPADSSKKALLSKSSDKHKHDHHKHKDSKCSHECKSDHKSKHSSRKEEKKCKCSNSKGEASQSVQGFPIKCSPLDTK